MKRLQVSIVWEETLNEKEEAHYVAHKEEVHERLAEWLKREMHIQSQINVNTIVMEEE